MQNSGPYALCDQALETLDHLLVHYVVARESWFKIIRPLGWKHLTPTTSDSMVAWWLRYRKQVTKARWKAFYSLAFLVAWSIWLECNSRVFNRTVSIVATLISCIRCHVKFWCRAGFVNRLELLGE
jgi:hypothetical protein